ncbi:DUF4352 domain-containing protein [Luteipulveratus halotolerans]|uniref:DUF4352 domain-containing protein n=1 Tax=Luteipulveratus halotolerans TaxID=1631356 RepID=A0A0L6CL84_9MICO|nr:DUF4352 domain-containing protein [Luteipulveratus halotolerans]KNX38556.1 hypothetical protein VV01_17640 [Luteipulveratus halotolerans]
MSKRHHDNNGQPPVPPSTWGTGQPGEWQPGTPPAPGGQYVPPQRPGWVARHKVLTGLAGLMVVGGIAAAASGGGSGTGSSEGASQSPVAASEAPAAAAPAGTSSAAAKKDSKPAAKKEEKKGAGIGSPVRDGKFEFTVTKVQSGRKSVGGEFLNEKAQGQFVLVTVKVRNTGDETRALSDMNQKVFDANGKSYEANSMAGAVISNDNKVMYEDINPGNQVTGVLVFDMPVGATPAKIELHDSMFSGGVTVDLR